MFGFGGVVEEHENDPKSVYTSRGPCVPNIFYVNET